MSIVTVAPSAASFLRSRETHASSVLSSTTEPSGQPAVASERRRTTWPGAVEQLAQDAELDRRERGARVADEHRVRHGVQTQTADLEALASSAPSQQRPYAFGEFPEGERLDHVVVATHVEAGDAVGHRVARGQEHDGHGVPARTQRRADIAPVRIGKPDIEDEQIGPARVERAQEIGAGGDRLDREVLLAQPADDEVAQTRIVLGQEHGVAHTSSMPVQRGSGHVHSGVCHVAVPSL